MRNYCTSCGAFYDLDFIGETEGIPRCPKDNGIVKPDVVLYEEALNSTTLIESVRAIEAADMMIVAGTSLVVYPAAGLLDYFKGDTLVLINKEATSRDNIATLVIHAGIGETLCGD